jgi:hypothetical protein
LSRDPAGGPAASRAWRERLAKLTGSGWRDRIAKLAVSPLLRDRLLVALAPDSVSWVRLAALPRPHATAHGAVDADPEHGREPWAGAVAALRAASEAWQRERVAVTVVLSNHFVRYALVEAPPRGVSPEEELALARFHFTKLHGERANAWDVRVSPQTRGSPRVASAVDRELIDELQSIFPRAASPRLASVQPYLMSAFNRWRDRLGAAGGWLVLPEPGRVCLALVSGDVWQALQSARSAGEAPDDWLALLDREAQRAPVQPVPTTVLARSDARVDDTTVGSWQLVTLHPPGVEGISDAERERYAMALHAA